VLGLVGPFVVAALLVPIGLPVSLGPLLMAVVACGAAGLGIGLIAGAAFWFGGRLGFGPLAPTESTAPSPAPEGWLRPGWGFGVPAAWTAFCLAIVPLVIYVALYVPWSMPWQAQVPAGSAAAVPLPAITCWHVNAATGVCDDAWPAGHTGQTLWDLTVQMYDYHNDLRASHPASSPWWAWPLDLRPVWFESGSAGGAVTSIHDGGNVVLWWLAIPGMAFAAWQAFRRRSVALGLVVMAFLWLWLGWSRIDRATFEYHFYTALPFFLLARVGVAAALLLPAVLWLIWP
jgi:hypothetical protein